MIDYSKLREAMKNSGYTEYDFINKGHISNTVLQNIREGKSITLKSLEKICRFIGLKDASCIMFIDDDEDEHDDIYENVEEDKRE